MLNNKVYDICVVGGGVAGALVAKTAIEKGKQVLLIEAGSRFSFENRLDQLKRNRLLGERLWPWEDERRDAYTNSGDIKYHLNVSRVKAVGGSTLHWGGKALRLNESDFRTKTLYGLGIDWPISYAEIEQYYGKAENEIGVSGNPNPTDPPRSTPYPMPGFPHSHDDLGWMPTAKKLGINLDFVSHARNSIPKYGRSQCVAYAVCNVCPSGAKYSADFHIEKLIQFENFTLITETVAHRINLDNNENVTAIYASTLEGKEYEIKAKKFVIAAHAIESARLLLLSKIGNHSDQVGRNLMEHWYAAAGGIQSTRQFPERIGFSTMESRHYYDGPDRTERGAFTLEFGGGGADPLEDVEHMNLWGKKLAKYDCEQFGHWLTVSAEIEHQPNPDSRITLDKNKTDSFGDPVPHIHFALDKIDHITHEKAHKAIETLLAARGINDIKRTHNFVRAHHHIGTCRMSNDPDLGVVDKNCRVYGTSNLYLAGSSVFPTSSGRQPTLTIAALAIRLGEYIS